MQQDWHAARRGPRHAFEETIMIDAEILPVPTTLPPSLMAHATFGTGPADIEGDAETQALLDSLDAFLDRLDLMTDELRQLGIATPTVTTGFPGLVAVPV